MDNQSINLLAGNVLMASRAIPDPTWTVSEKDGGAIMDARGEMVLYPLDLITTEEVLNLLKNVCFIRNAAPILASRAARAVRIAQELTEALDRIKDTQSETDGYSIALEALAKAAAFGINPRGRENSVK